VAIDYVSLFSGCGGLDLGLEKAGLRKILATDRDGAALQTAASSTYMASSDVWESDISELIDSGMLKNYRDAGVVAGGPPCQGFSVAGYMDPDDPRSQLVYRFMDAVEILRPKAFIMESVAALASKRWKYVLSRLRVTADRLGFDTTVVVLNAADYGVPQNRKRMFLIGMPRGKTPVSSFWENKPNAESPVTVRQTLSPVKFYAHDDLMCRANIVPAANPVLRKSPYAGMLVNGGGRIIDLDAPAPVIAATIGGNNTPIIDLNALDRDSKPWVETYHAHLMAGGEPFPELPPFGEVRLRRITLYEAAALQGFTCNFRFEGKTMEKWSQAGNAVPPILGEVVGNAVAFALR
jgi:DNA (cytosine-5)-methyltransferase 1